MDVNATKEKKLTNIRAAGADEALRLIPPRVMSLEKAIEFINEDELVEVTPGSVRLRKKILAAGRRPRRKEKRPGGQAVHFINTATYPYMHATRCQVLAGGFPSATLATLRPLAAIPLDGTRTLSGGHSFFARREHQECPPRGNPPLRPLAPGGETPQGIGPAGHRDFRDAARSGG